MADGWEETEADEADLDYRKMKQTHQVTGYREGLDSGKEAYLQQGFNQGFIYGANLSREWGKLRGVLSALTSFVGSKYVQDLNPNIEAEITELLALVNQMEKHALDAETMQYTLENRMNQAQYSLKPLDVNRQKRTNTNNTQEEHELSSAFETLHTQDRDNGIGDLRVECETQDRNNAIGDLRVKSGTIEDRVETSGNLMGTAMTSISSNFSSPLEASKTELNEIEKLWSRTVSLADRIGINQQKILLVKHV